MKKMARIFVKGENGVLQDVVIVEKGTNLRKALLEEYRHFLYHKSFQKLNCHGFGSCGTCALRVEGLTSKRNKIEALRLSLPPHKNSIKKHLRLACQTRVLGDVWIDKLPGRWGQGDDSSIRNSFSFKDIVQKRAAVYPKAWHIDPEARSDGPVKV